MNEHLHVAIENPNSHRKELLNINVSLIDVLKGLENIKKIRNRKSIQISKLRSCTKRLNKDIKELNGHMPSSEEPAFIKKNRNPKSTKTAKKVGASDMNIGRLEDQLKELKEKINSL